MSKSDCCGADINKQHDLCVRCGAPVCPECSGEIMEEHSQSKNPYTGKLGIDFLDRVFCSKCNKDVNSIWYNPPKETIKLTPEQVKAIRWPSTEEMERYSNMITSSFPYRRYFRAGVEWAIEYALKDLVE